MIQQPDSMLYPANANSLSGMDIVPVFAGMKSKELVLTTISLSLSGGLFFPDRSRRGCPE